MSIKRTFKEKKKTPSGLQAQPGSGSLYGWVTFLPGVIIELHFPKELENSTSALRAGCEYWWLLDFFFFKKDDLPLCSIYLAFPTLCLHRHWALCHSSAFRHGLVSVICQSCSLDKKRYLCAKFPHIRLQRSASS